jgi:hypothetical protein
MIRNNDIIQGYTVLMVANGMVLAHSETAPDPYVVWHTTEDRSGVYDGKYLPNKEDAEWDFCMKAFPWFEDNAPVTMIEDEVDKTQKTLKYLLQGARECIVGATAKVDELVKEHARLMGKEKAPQERNAEPVIDQPALSEQLSKLKEGIKKSGVPDTVVIDNGSTFDAPKGSETITASKKEFSNPSWTVTPRLAIDEHGISLGGVYLPDITRFSLKDSGDLDGTFILDIETDVVLATAPVEKTVAEHENPVAKKKAPQEENAESVIDYISGFDFEMSAKIQSSVSDLLSKTRSKHS